MKNKPKKRLNVDKKSLLKGYSYISIFLGLLGITLQINTLNIIITNLFTFNDITNVFFKTLPAYSSLVVTVGRLVILFLFVAIILEFRREKEKKINKPGTYE